MKTINDIIGENTPVYESNNIKKKCSVFSMPLKDQMSGMVLKVNLPDTILAKQASDKSGRGKDKNGPDSLSSTKNLPIVVKKPRKT
jgi:hypothetical protein